MVSYVLYVLRAGAHVVGGLDVFARDGGVLYAVFDPVVCGCSVLNVALCVSWCALFFDSCSVIKMM